MFASLANTNIGCDDVGMDLDSQLVKTRIRIRGSDRISSDLKA